MEKQFFLASAYSKDHFPHQRTRLREVRGFSGIGLLP
jgi:hypothetical protein